MRIGVLNGPNLNLLGTREVQHYGRTTLAGVEELLRGCAAEAGADLAFFQSNHEGELVDWVQREAGSVDGWLVNAGGLSHASIPLRDALVATGRPFVEVHLSNIFSRERFRRESVLAEVAVGVVAGFRERSYLLGLEALLAHIAGGR